MVCDRLDPLVPIVDNRLDLVDLNVLTFAVDYGVAGLLQRLHQFRTRMLIQNSGTERWQLLVLLASVDERSVAKQFRESKAVERHAEVFRLVAHLRKDFLVQLGHLSVQLTESHVVEHFVLVLLRQLLAHFQRAFPHLAVVEESNDFLVKLFLQVPVGLAVRVTTRTQQRRQLRIVPEQQLAVEFQRKRSFGIVVELHVQVAQFVDVPDVHFLPVDFGVELQQADGARHSILFALVVDQEAILEQPLHQFRGHVDEDRSLVAQRDVLHAQVHHDFVEEVFVLVVAASALDQNVELLDHLLLELPEVPSHVRNVPLGVAEAFDVKLR